jgi:hypothetical protein
MSGGDGLEKAQVAQRQRDYKNRQIQAGKKRVQVWMDQEAWQAGFNAGKAGKPSLPSAAITDQLAWFAGWTEAVAKLPHGAERLKSGIEMREKVWSYSSITKYSMKRISLLMDGDPLRSQWAYGIYLGWYELTCGWQVEGDDEIMSALTKTKKGKG